MKCLSQVLDTSGSSPTMTTTKMQFQLYLNMSFSSLSSSRSLLSAFQADLRDAVVLAFQV